MLTRSITGGSWPKSLKALEFIRPYFKQLCGFKYIHKLLKTLKVYRLKTDCISMLFLRFSLLLAIVFSVHVKANWQDSFCPSSFSLESAACPVSSESTSTRSGPIPSYLLEFSALDEGANSLLNQIQNKVDDWGDFTRWLKGTPLRGSSDGFDERWKTYEEQARALIEVEQSLSINKKRRHVCYQGNCGAARRVELEVEQQRLEKIKLNLFSIAPWWLSDEFIALSESNENPSSDELKQALVVSMTDFFKQSFKLRSDIEAIKASIALAFNSQKNPTMLMSELLMRHPNGLEAIVQRSMITSNPDDQKLLCLFLDRKTKVEGTLQGLETAFEIGLITSSLLIGPESLLLMGASRGALSRGVLGRIRGFFGGASRSTAFMADAAFSGKLIKESLDKFEECKRIMAQTQLGLSNHQDWESCIEAHSKSVVNASIGSLLSVGGFTLPLVQALIKPRSSPVTFRHLENNGIISRLDLSRKAEMNSNSMGQVSDRYWDFVADVYRQRLNLTPQEITSFIQSSRAFEPRTKLIVMTRGPPVENRIEGGVALVESQKSTDLLPFEKATGVQVSRENGKIAEIVRLTSVSDSNPNLMKDLLAEMAQTIKADPKIKKLYVYTSKVHARLYKRLGINAKQIGEPIDRDVIIEIDAAEFISTLSAP